MLKFREYLMEGTSTEDAIPAGIPKTLHDFLFHLSGPSDPVSGNTTGLQEAKVTLNLTNKTAGLPKTTAMIDKANQEGLGANENLHRRIAQGFQSAFDSMENEDPKTYAERVRDSKRVFKEFAQSRGLKAATAPDMLRGNMKTEKSSGEGVLTTGLNLAPHATAGLNGFDVCPKASQECRANCLGTEAGGNRQYPDTALSSKVLRTQFLAAHPEHAARLIDHEITQHEKRARKMGMIPGIRMNVTSDLSWEHYAPQLFQRHSGTQFYDYSKLPNRVLRSLAPPVPGSNSNLNSMGHPVNYHLTLSHTGTDHAESNDKAVSEVLKRGGVVAMVFKRGKKSGGLPKEILDHATGNRYPVVNGDDDDNTFDRHTTSGRTEGQPNQGVVSGLMLKGVKNEDAGAFANEVDSEGIAHINRPKSLAENVIRKVLTK